jgi:chromosome segregation ATPase
MSNQVYQRQIATSAAAWLLLALFVFSVVPAHAEEKSSREREALRRVQQSLRQTQEERDALNGEKSSLVQAKDQLAAELKQTAAKAKGVESKAAALRAQITQLEATVQSRDEALAAAQAREQDLNEKLLVTQSALAERTRLFDNVKGMLARSTQEQNTLIAQNKGLYDTGLALIDLYRSQSPSTWLKLQEATLGFQGVTVESLAETFRTRLDDARYQTLDVSQAQR